MSKKHSKKAMEYLKNSGIADTAYFGPENEFFVFDSVKIVDTAHCSKYEVDTEEGEWNDDRRLLIATILDTGQETKVDIFQFSQLIL